MRFFFPTVIFGLMSLFVHAQSDFITTWKTDNPGVSEDNQIMIPTLPGETYNYNVDWGDGTLDVGVTGSIIHTYSAPGTYQISISGVFPSIFFNNVSLSELTSDSHKILTVKEWGSNPWASMRLAFAGCSNLVIEATDAPNLSNVFNLEYMFYGCSNLALSYPNFNDWNVETIFDMDLMFTNSSFNQDISNWNVSNVFYMSYLFWNSDFNQDINNWNVSNVRDMSYMFGLSSFNQNLSNWDVSNVTDMSYMFYTTTFDQDISNWNVSNVTNMSNLFWSSSFNQNINNWNVSNVTDMSYMFGSGLFNQDLSNWDVSNVTDMSFMFFATNFSKDITGWDVSNVVNMERMLNESNFDYDIGNWNVSKVNNMRYMLDDCSLSDENYDKILLGWSQLPSLQFGVELGAIDSQYCVAENARADLISNYNWTIIDSGKACITPTPFITTWKTDNIGISNDNQITIPTNPRHEYNFTVDWGDGTSNTDVTGDITHTYASPGTYTVSITGKFPSIFFNDYLGILADSQEIGDHDKIISIDQWGTNRWEDMGFAFAGCTNLDMQATDIPDFTRGIGESSQMRRFTGMFLGCTSLIGNDSMNLWNMRYAQNASWMFRGASMFNQDLNNWNVSSLEYINDMFYEATSFDQDLGNWDITNVRNMDNMFLGVKLSTTNYDNILIGWESQAPRNGLSFNAGYSEYCNGLSARNSLINNFGWTIVDGDLNCPESQLDDDNDGVMNDVDECPNSNLNSIVNENGCFVLPEDNFTVETTSETCSDKNNGQIKITANQSLNYITFINDVSYSFMDELTVDDLAPGIYSFCIGVENESFEQCFTIELAEGAEISGKINTTGQRSEIDILHGTPPFVVSVNQKQVLSTMSNKIQLDVNDGDIVKVSSSKSCEGSLEKVISVNSSLVAFPNPTQGKLEIIVPSATQEKVEIEIYNTQSKLISTQHYNVVNKRVYLDLTDQPAGLYLIKVLTTKPIDIKIIKE